MIPIVDQIEKYFHLKELLEKEKGLEQMLINKILDNLGLQISASRNLIYDEAVLKDKIIAMMQPEFVGVCKKMRALPEIVVLFLLCI